MFPPRSARPSHLAALAFALVAACGSGGGSTPIDATATDAVVIDTPPAIDAPVLPPFRNPVSLGDLELAQQAVERLGVGPRNACDNCHALTPARFNSWLAETQAADANCLTDTTPTNAAEALAILECFRDPVSHQWAPGRLGIYATNSSLEWFYNVFQLAYGNDWTSQWVTWTQRVTMPRGAQDLLTQGEFDIVAEWFARGLPELATVVPDMPDPPGCTQTIGAEVDAHVTAMQTQGWTALNQAAGILMLGCAGATTPGQCLTTYPLASTQTYAAGWTQAAPTATIRLLHTYPYNSSYWTRSSADGRFVAHGGGGAGATIIDLQNNRRIPAAANYDPGFFPDNSGFVIQGGAKAWCRQSLLTSNPAQVTFNEPQCTNVAVVGLYQHLGAASGGDYWTVNGQFVSDNGGGEPPAWFDAGSTDELTPMVWNGTAYSPKSQISVANPYAGDTIISPSAKLLLSRVAGAGNTQNGFVLKKLVATPSGGGYTVTTPQIGRYCVSGGKPGFSYDERWITYHHWVQPGDWQAMGYASQSDPAFQALVSSNTANVFLLDLTTGVSRRITSMAPGQEALFPHFRSDGWIYFIVKGATAGEVIAASDAALIFGT